MVLTLSSGINSELLSLALYLSYHFNRFASGNGGLTNLELVNVSPLTVPILCGIIATTVQIFFMYRIYTLRPTYWWICVIIVLVCGYRLRKLIALILIIHSYPFSSSLVLALKDIE